MSSVSQRTAGRRTSCRWRASARALDHGGGALQSDREQGVVGECVVPGRAVTVGRAGEGVTAGLVEVAGVGEGEGGAREVRGRRGCRRTVLAGVVAPVAFRLGERVAVGRESREQRVAQSQSGCADRSGSRPGKSRGGRARRGRCLRPGASSRRGRRLRGTSGRGSPRSRGAGRAVGGAASWWWRLRCGRAAAAGRRRPVGERAAISTWFWRGAFTETARLSKPMSFRLSLKRAWCSPSTNSVSTSTSMSSAAMAWITAGGIAFLPVRWFRFQAARWRVSACVWPWWCDPGEGWSHEARAAAGTLGTARKWWEGQEMRASRVFLRPVLWLRLAWCRNGFGHRLGWRAGAVSKADALGPRSTRRTTGSGGPRPAGSLDDKSRGNRRGIR